ncbi:hypothetical protein [Lichenicoccus roseus]|uniref:Uncharacterized protein n=1 Tax=Lichenicoccus roseus TaxID=2683649 RepID=A0A5R9J0X4_9PROT|nr:hypothetical protein [Lichenicoccus roseus]TLU70589.1 hypothetical protein FE263_21120 [Lichenicoccus roseus]
MSKAFTPEDDALMIDLRQAGMDWPAVSKRLGRPGVTLSARLRRIAPDLASRDQSAPVARRVAVDGETNAGPPTRGFDAMPAGSPVSWLAIWTPAQLLPEEEEEAARRRAAAIATRTCSA